MRCICIFFIMLAVSVLTVFAGPNKNASAALDYDVTTPSVESALPQMPVGTRMTVGAVGHNLEGVHSYSLRVTYNSDVVQFVNGAKSLSILTPSFLESRGGKTIAFLVMPEDSSVEIASTMAGKDPALCVGGNGILAYIQFSVIGKGKPDIQLSYVKVVTADGLVDEVTLGEVQ